MAKIYIGQTIVSDDNAIKNEIIGGAPELLNTLDELAAALGDDQNYATSTATLLGQKLVITNNLSDLNSATTARTNLGLGTAATTDASAYATAAQGAKADSAEALTSLFSSFGATLIDDADAATARTTLGLGTVATTASSDYAPAAGSSSIQTVGTLASLTVTGNVTGTANPTSAGHLVNKIYAETNFQSKDGATGDVAISGNVGIGLSGTPSEALDIDGHFQLNISSANRTAGKNVALIKSDDKTAANLRVEGPVAATHDLFKNSGVTNGFADNSNHFHTIQKINRITQQSGSGTPNERVQEQYYAIADNNLKNSKAAFWNWHRVAREIPNTAVALTNLVGWNVSGIQDSSNRTATSQVSFPTGGAEATTFTFDTAGNNPFTLNDVLQITISIDFEGAIVAATLFAKVTAVSGATATVVLYGGNYKSTDEVADGNSQTALTNNFTVEKIDTTQYMALSSGTGIDVLSDSTRTTTTDTFSLTFASAHSLQLNDTVTIITDSSGGFQAAEVAFVKEVTSTTAAKFVYGRVFEPASRLALSDIAAGSVVGVLRGSLDGLHRFTAGDQLMHFNADNQGRYKSYQIGPGSEVGADCIAIGKNVYNKDASTIKIGYDNNMLNIDSAGIDVAGTVNSTGLTVSGAVTIDSQTLTVDSTNNRVGVGTNAPIAPLHVRKGVTGGTLTRQLRLTNDVNAQGTGSGIIFDMAGLESDGHPPFINAAIDSIDNESGLRSGNLIFSTRADATGGDDAVIERMRIAATGEIGIGLTNPSTSLHIKDSIPEFRLEDKETGARAGIQASDGNLEFYADDGATAINSNIVFQIDNIERMRINATGEVGIGKTATAGVELDVNGDIKASGSITPGIFADASARDAAISSPAAGMMIFLTAGTKFQGYTGSAWVDLN